MTETKYVAHQDEFNMDKMFTVCRLIRLISELEPTATAIFVITFLKAITREKEGGEKENEK